MEPGGALFALPEVGAVETMEVGEERGRALVGLSGWGAKTVGFVGDCWGRVECDTLKK